MITAPDMFREHPVTMTLHMAEFSKLSVENQEYLALS